MNTPGTFPSRVSFYALCLIPFLTILIALSATDGISAQQPARRAVQFHAAQSIPYTVTNTDATAFASQQLRPAAMLSEDVDGDGVPDLLIGYSLNGQGEIVLLRGNIDAVAPQTHESWLAAGKGNFSTPFLPEASTTKVPESADLLAVADVTGDGLKDVLFSSINGRKLYVLQNNGKGKFTPLQEIAFRGSITAIAAYPLHLTASNSVLIGTSGEDGDHLILLSPGKNGLQQQASYRVSGPISSIQIANLDADAILDALIVADNQLSILHGKNVAQGNATLETLPLAQVSSATTGNFIFDRHAQTQISALTTDGTMHIFAHSGYDSRPYSQAETSAIRKRATMHAQPLAFVQTGGNPWVEIESIPGSFSAGVSSGSPIVLNNRTTPNGKENILVVDGARDEIESIHHFAPSASTSLQQYTTAQSSLSGSALNSGDVITALTQKATPTGGNGVVLLRKNSIRPQIITPANSNVLYVNTTADTLDANDSVRCTQNNAEPCSLRDAITYANEDAAINISSGTSDTIMIPSGTYNLTYQSGVLDSNGNAETHLEILGPMAITGDTTGGGVTINAQNFDTVFTINPGAYGSYNPSGSSYVFDTTLTNITIEGGNNVNNPLTAFTNNVGGAINWDAYGTGNLTLNNCNIEFNTIQWGAGGGIWTLNSAGGGSGTLTLNGSNISNNATPEEGGGIYNAYPPVAIAATNTTISGNTASPAVNNIDGSAYGAGGGVYLNSRNGSSGTPDSSFTNVTFASNSSTVDGGGIYTNSGISLALASINGNSAGRWGGGLFSQVDSPEIPTSIYGTNFFANSAASDGGGIAVGPDAAANGNLLTITNSRIFSNTSTSGVSGLSVGASSLSGAGGVTATENWWGCNDGPVIVSDGCDQALLYDAGTGSMTTDPRIVLSYFVTPNPVNVNSTLQLNATLNTDSGGGMVSAGSGTMPGMSVTFNTAVGSFSETSSTAIDLPGTVLTATVPTQIGSGTSTATIDNQTISASFTVNAVAGPATHFVVTAPSTVVASNTNAITVTALDASNNTATGYTGTVVLASSDFAFTNLSGPQTLTNGIGTFSIILKTAGNQTITAVDTVQSAITGTSNNVAVVAGPAVVFVVTAPVFAVPGKSFSYTVTALDGASNVASGYAGTVHFSSTDASATLPADASLTNGIGTFSATLQIQGLQTITAIDTVTSSILGTSGTITVVIPNLVVTTTGDDAGVAANCTIQSTPGTGIDAACSLRDALLEADTLGAAKITFDSVQFAAAKIISLGSSFGSLSIPANTTVSGPTSGSGPSLTNLLTISGDGTVQIFSASTTSSNSSLANLIIANGDSATNGGGLSNNGGTINVYNSTFSSNSASGTGGGIFNAGNLTLVGCTITNNTTAAGESGAGIYNDSGVLTIQTSTLTGNASGLHAGAIYLNTGTLTIINTTITGNSANAANSGIDGGINNNAGTLTITNSILAEDTGGECSGSGCPVNGVNGNVVDAAIELSPLGSYGGATQTLLPLPGSPAICTTSPSSATGMDQRGNPRTTTYSAISCEDSGAVQTNYAITFGSNFPASAAISQNFAASVNITESGNALAAGNPDVNLTLNGNGTLTSNGATPVTGNFTNGVASFPALQISAAGTNDSLTASLLLTAPSTTQQVVLNVISPSFDVATAFTTTTEMNTTAIYSASVQSIALTATVTSTYGTVNAGTVTFTVLQGSTPIGAPTTSTILTNNTASVSYILPAGTAAGIYTIQAAYNAAGGFSASSDNTHTLTIGQATAAVTLGNLAQVYTGSPLAIVATAVPAGLSVSITYNGSTTPPTAAGSYAVVATINDPNYQGTASGTFVISKAVELLSWTPTASITYGTPLSGLLNANASFQSHSAAGTLSYTATPSGGSATAVSSSTVLTAGTYVLSVLFTPTDQSDFNPVTLTVPLTVNPAALAVNANNATKIYGTANPTLSGSVTGAVNGDGFVESFATSAITSSNVGTYAIVPSVSGANLSSYLQTLTNGTLTITKAPSTITLSSNSSTVTPGQTLTLTIQVQSTTTGTPTGSVNILDGAALLTTVTLSAGTASYSTTSLTSGVTHTLTAVYNGDTNFQTSTSATGIGVSVAPLDFTLSIAGPSSAFVAPGATLTYTATVTPLYGSYAAPVNFTSSGLPPGATLTFSPSSITAGSGTQTITITLQIAPSTTASQKTQLLRPHFLPIYLSLLSLPLIALRVKRVRKMFYVIVFSVGSLAASTLLNGCGSGGSFAKMPQTYAVTILAESGNIEHSTTLTITVE